ncbi:Fc.00g026610.m01.CDS01 [Cosmosporella sp. VM-42]
MPFDFKAYDKKCNGLTLEELQREWEHYTRLISGAATSTAVSGMAIPLTLGISTIGVAMSAPAIHNARKKREIIERHLNKLNATHHTRKRDVLGSMAVSGTIGVVTLGVGSMGADAVATAGAEHGIQAVVANETAIKIVTHAALDGAGMAVEHAHTNHLKKKDAFKAFKKAGVFTAVQNAKAAEAGYAAQPYNNQGYPYSAGSSSSQALPMPPPPYSAAISQTPGQPTYAPNPNGYPQDFKAPMAQTPAPQQSQSYMTPNANGQQPAPQYYGYSQQQAPPQQQQVFSPPQTPAVGYPPHVIQTRESIQSPMIPQPQPYMQDPQHPAPFAQTSAIPPYNPTTSSQTFNMNAMNEALPTPTTPYQRPQSQFFSNAALPTPPQENTQAYTYPPPPAQPSVPNQTFQAPPTEYFPSVSATPTGYPPPVSLPPQPTPQPPPVTQVPLTESPYAPQMSVKHAVQHSTGPQGLATQHTQQQYHQYSTYTSPQHTGPYQQTQVPPPPPPADPNRRDSVISSPQQTFTPQPSYNPQHYGPISQQQQPYTHSTYAATSAPAQASQVAQTPVQYQVPPPSQAPMGTNVTQYQYDSTGAYYSNAAPAGQPQKPYASGAQWQNAQPAHQPHYYPQSNYPPTPVSLPNSPPAAQYVQGPP